MICSSVRSPVEPRRHVLAVDELHRDEVAAADRLGVEDGDHVRVAQLRHRARLAQQPGLRGVVAGERGPQHLQRDLAIELGVVREPHGAHAAGAELALEPILADLLAGVHAASTFASASGGRPQPGW